MGRPVYREDDLQSRGVPSGDTICHNAVTSIVAASPGRVHRAPQREANWNQREHEGPQGTGNQRMLHFYEFQRNSKTTNAQ